MLWYYAEPNLDAKMYDGFSSQLYKELSIPLANLGYCLTPYKKNDTLSHSFLYQENLLMRVAGKNIRENNAQTDEEKRPELTASLISLKNFSNGNIETEASSDRLLVALSFAEEDIGSILIIFEKKIIENLRIQYICNLMISSEPPGAKVTSHSGLSDVTPFEWVVPVGKLNIQCDLKDYITYKKEIKLNRPGVYNYFLQMKKRQIYHSKFFYPGAGCGLIAVGCYYFDNFFYNQYKNLGENELKNDPNSFHRTFITAKTFEDLSISFLILSCSFLSLSIWF